MATTTIATITVGTITYTLVDNDSGKDYAQTCNPLRFTITKGGATLSRKFASFRNALKHYGSVVMQATLTQSIAAQPRHYAGVS